MVDETDDEKEANPESKEEAKSSEPTLVQQRTTTLQFIPGSNQSRGDYLPIASMPIGHTSGHCSILSPPRTLGGRLASGFAVAAHVDPLALPLFSLDFLGVASLSSSRLERIGGGAPIRLRQIAQEG